MTTHGERSPAPAAAAERANWPAVLNGLLMRASEAAIPATDDGLIRGDGVFDAFRLHRGRPFARSAHLDRLERSCAALDLPCPRAELERDIDTLLGEAGQGEAVVRVILTRGGARLCLLEARGDPEALARPARVLPVVYDPSVLLNGVKSLSYAANMLAARRAQAEGFDEAVLVGSDGTVLESTTHAIFWARAGALRTPALATGILASITRRVLVERLTVQEGVFALEDLLGADEAFLASTSRDAQPISTIAATTLPAAPGPRTLEAQQVIEGAMREGTLA